MKNSFILVLSGLKMLDIITPVANYANNFAIRQQSIGSATPGSSFKAVVINGCHSIWSGIKSLSQ